MTAILTITEKGQTTIPVAMRRKLGLTADGGKLQVHFDEDKNVLVVAKALTARDVAGSFGKYIRPGTPPLMDPRRYYLEHRTVT